MYDKIAVVTSRTYVQLMVLAITVAAIFYPTVHAEVSLIDDADMLNWLHSLPDFSGLRQVLFPGGTQGGYYRPLIGISYLADRFLFNADPIVMHLEGVLFHLINVFLVYYLTRECLQLDRKKQDGYFPFAAALLFGLHPITTESVNWISGRTDIMMGNCVLTGSILLIRFKRTGRIGYLATALVAVLVGALAKETAFACLAGVGLVLLARDGVTPVNSTEPGTGRPVNHLIDFLLCYSLAFLAALLLGNYWLVLACCVGYWCLTIYRRATTNSGVIRSALKPFLFTIMVGVVSVVLFLVLRRLAFTTDAGKIGNTVRLMFADLNYSISLFIGAFGFYVQKFIFPWPLNFFILEIDPLYDFAGIAVLLLMIRLLAGTTLNSAIFIMGAGMIIPVLPLVFGTIAWTSYAERYIYLPSAFWSVSLVLIAAKLIGTSAVMSRFLRYGTTVAFALILMVYAFTTWQRNVVWQKNVTLLQDTVEQSPKAKPLRDFYMAALFNAGRYDEALQQHTSGLSLHSLTYDPVPDLLAAKIQQSRKRYRKAFELYEKANARTGYASVQSLNSMIDFLEIAGRESASELPRAEAEHKVVRYRQLLDQRRNSPTPVQNERQRSSGT